METRQPRGVTEHHTNTGTDRSVSVCSRIQPKFSPLSWQALSVESALSSAASQAMTWASLYVNATH
jgi:hypothetical protein